MPDTRTPISPKQRWKDAVSKFKRATVPEQNDLGKLSDELIDCVRVRVTGTIEADKVKPYLEEIARGKQTLGNYEYPILRMDPDQLKKHQLFYEPSSASLKDHNNKLATTVGKESKHTKNIQAFIFAKDGSLYMGTHKGQYDPINPTLTHASFLAGRPVEMAGMISINKSGKIDMISSDSGHYAPEPLDMYRGIKKMQQLMPDSFTPDAKIQYYDGTKYTIEIRNFMDMMDKPKDGKPLHQELRDKRIQQVKKYTQNLKGASSIKIDSNTADLPSAIANLTEEKTTELAASLKNPMVSISLKTPDGKIAAYNISDMIISVINSGKTEAIQKLLDNGITERKEFHNIKPLYYASAHGMTKMAETMLNNPVIQESLKQEAYGTGLSSLHIAATNNHPEIINLLIKQPAGYNLITKRDYNGNTPLEVANNLGKLEASEILYKEHSALAKKQLIVYLTDAMKDKQTITTDDKKKMKQTVIEILSPLSSEKNKQDILDVAGSIVRESAEIAGKKLDLRQKISAIGDVIKDKFFKIISSQKQQKFKNILKDANVNNELKKLRTDYNLTKDSKGLTTVSKPLGTTYKNNKGDQITRF